MKLKISQILFSQFIPGMKNRHDEVVAEDHWVGDDDHGGEAELHEASDQLVEEGDDEEKGEDPEALLICLGFAITFLYG